MGRFGPVFVAKEVRIQMTSSKIFQAAVGATDGGGG